MALSIIKRPEGGIIDYTSALSTTITNGSGNAVINSITTYGNGATAFSGDLIYIKGDKSRYNGFWYLSDPSTGLFVEYWFGGSLPPYQTHFADASVTVYFCARHNWSCVHLPIVYKLQSTLWPTNTVDTSRTVSSFANDSNYTKLTLSGSLGTFNALNYVKISGANSSAVNGNWQILTKTSSSVVTLNLSYNASYDFTGASVILYYNNYKAQINVWAGLNSNNQWAVFNRYSKILSLAVVPDNENIVNLNVNEYLKVDLNILSNNLLLDSLPNNIDFWDQFYIEYEESYDQSDGTNVTTYTSGFTSDQTNFEGYSINSKLPFKTVESGYMSQYILNGSGKFLTDFSSPYLFATSLTNEYYSDVSFINNLSKNITGLILRQTYYANNIQQTTIDKNINNTGAALYRVSIDFASTNFDRVDLSVIGTFSSDSTNNISSLHQLSGTGTWSNAGGTYPVDYSNSSSGTSRIGYLDCELPAGSYYVTGTANGISSASNIGTIIPYFLDSNFNIIATGLTSTISSTFQGIGGGTMVIQRPCRYIAFKGTYSSGSGTFHVGLNYAVYNNGTDLLTAIPALLSEVKSFSIVNINTVTSSNVTDFKPGDFETDDFNVFGIHSKKGYCADQSIPLTWLNKFGGFDYWSFDGRSTHSIDITDSTTQLKNIYTNWPNSWGEFADTIKNETKRVSFVRTLVRSQNVNKDQVDSIAQIKTSPLIQIINSTSDKRTVLIDSQSFDIRKDGDKTFNISFSIIYTDQISNQEL